MVDYRPIAGGGGDRGIEVPYRGFQRRRLKPERCREGSKGVGPDRRQRRRQGAAEASRIHDQIGDLARAVGDARAPSGEMRLARILALVVKSCAVAVDDDAVWNSGDAGDDAAVELWSARVDRNHVAA